MYCIQFCVSTFLLFHPSTTWCLQELMCLLLTMGRNLHHQYYQGKVCHVLLLIASFCSFPPLNELPRKFLIIAPLSWSSHIPGYLGTAILHAYKCTTKLSAQLFCTLYQWFLQIVDIGGFYFVCPIGLSHLSFRNLDAIVLWYAHKFAIICYVTYRKKIFISI